MGTTGINTKLTLARFLGQTDNGPCNVDVNDGSVVDVTRLATGSYLVTMGRAIDPTRYVMTCALELTGGAGQLAFGGLAVNGLSFKFNVADNLGVDADPFAVHFQIDNGEVG